MTTTRAASAARSLSVEVAVVESSVVMDGCAGSVVCEGLGRLAQQQTSLALEQAQPAMAVFCADTAKPSEVDLSEWRCRGFGTGTATSSALRQT